MQVSVAEFSDELARPKVFKNGHKIVPGIFLLFGIVSPWVKHSIILIFKVSFLVKIQPKLCPQHAVRAGSKIKHVPLHVSFFAPQAR
jgi:hypothetical protein